MKTVGKKKKWTKDEENNINQLIEELARELRLSKEEEEETEENEEEVDEEIKECTCPLSELMKNGCRCGGV